MDHLWSQPLRCLDCLLLTCLMACPAQRSATSGGRRESTLNGGHLPRGALSAPDGGSMLSSSHRNPIDAGSERPEHTRCVGIPSSSQDMLDGVLVLLGHRENITL